MRNQKGFATLEIILVMLIISTLAGVVMPKMARVVDNATLNYEVRKFQSEFFFARSLGRSASYEPKIFKYSLTSTGNAITFETYSTNYHIEQNGNLIREKNFLPQGFSIKIQGNIQDVSFNSAGKIVSGKSGTYTLTSSLNQERSLRLDSVGRLRVDENN